MKLRTEYVAALLTAVLCGGVVLLAQAPAAKPSQAPAAAQPAPPVQAPTGIATLPISAKDQVKPDEVVLTIGPEKITRQRFEQIKAGLPPQYGNVPQQMGDRAFAGSYAQFRGLALLAEQQKLDQAAEFKEQLNFLRTELLARLALTQLQNRSQSVTDEEVKAYYDSHTDEFVQAKVKGIFVALNPLAKPAATPAAGGSAPKPETPKARTDEEAKARAEELRKQILAGADFATVAKANSDHQADSEKGGDLGTLRKGALPANLDKVVFSLKPKEVSEPVKEGQGYYIFLVDEIRPVTLDEATATIRNTLQGQKFNKTLEQVKVDFPVTFNDKYFAEPAQATGGGTRPVITGVAPAQPGAAGVPAPAAKPAAPPTPPPKKP